MHRGVPTRKRELSRVQNYEGAIVLFQPKPSDLNWPDPAQIAEPVTRFQRHFILLKQNEIFIISGSIVELNVIWRPAITYCRSLYTLVVFSCLCWFSADRTNGRAYATVLCPSSSSVTLCIVAKRCVLEQKLLLRAYRKSYMRNRLVPKWMTSTFV